MKVEMWADMVCVWCGVAMERMNKALEGFEHAERIDLEHRSFRLLPEHADGESWDFAEFMMAERGYSGEQTASVAARVEGMAHSDGVEDYHVSGNRVGNSTLAHEFLAWASEQGKHREAWNLVFRKHYAERADIWTIDDLLVFARELGLDEVAARQALETRHFRTKVEADHREVLDLGGSGVPFFVIDGRYAVSGAQPPEVLVGAMRRAWDERG